MAFDEIDATGRLLTVLDSIASSLASLAKNFPKGFKMLSDDINAVVAASAALKAELATEHTNLLAAFQRGQDAIAAAIANIPNSPGSAALQQAAADMQAMLTAAQTDDATIQAAFVPAPPAPPAPPAAQ